jgi:hypothetical protein
VDVITRLRGVWPDWRERLEPFKFHLMALIGAVGLGMMIGFIKVTRPPAKTADVDRWHLQTWTAFHAAPLRQELSGHTLFMQDPNKKKLDALAATTPQAPSWRFTGTVREGTRQIALIEVDKDKRVRRIAPGDELPGGAKVTAVKVDTLVYSDSSGEQELKLFAPTDMTAPSSPKPQK